MLILFMEGSGIESFAAAMGSLVEEHRAALHSLRDEMTAASREYVDKITADIEQAHRINLEFWKSWKERNSAISVFHNPQNIWSKLLKQDSPDRHISASSLKTGA